MNDKHPFADHPGFDTLDDRERQVLQYFWEGKGSKEISFFITTTERLVDQYREKIMDKLGIDDARDLVKPS